MDNLKIHDSQFNSRTTVGPRQFLELRGSSRLPNKQSRSSLDTSISSDPASKLLPRYSFSITGYSIEDYVQYNVVLRQQYHILRRKIVKEHTFITRYSMLEALDSKIGGMGLPGKKLFGNTNPEFVQRRKKELQVYLNRIAQCGQPEFYRFIKQIIDVSFNASLKQEFRLP